MFLEWLSCRWPSKCYAILSFLGLTDSWVSNIFALLEIVYGVSLVFSPHVLLFSILFYIQAFTAPDLKSMEDFQRLLVEDSQQEMPLPLK